MLNRTNSIIKEVVQKDVSSKPFILWNRPDSNNGGKSFLKRFPDAYTEIHLSSPMISPEFIISLKHSEEVCIIDKFFFKPDKSTIDQLHYENILKILSEISNNSCIVKIITSKTDHIEAFWGYVKDLYGNEIHEFQKLRDRVKVKYFKSGKEYNSKRGNEYLKDVHKIHDRFAIIDNNLWHFGAKVGGIHSELSAITGGWSASTTNAKDFFNSLWRDDPV